MAKKSTPWITIPDPSLHTPASMVGPQGVSHEPMKNKLLWGLAFGVLAVAAFGVLAPAQFGALLKGSLFESTGVPADQIKGAINPLNLLPSEKPKETEAEKGTGSNTGIVPSGATTSETPAVVQPQEKPVNVAVEPISDPEQVQVTPVAQTPEDCQDKTECLLPHLKDCSLAKAVLASGMGQGVEAQMEITGAEGGLCVAQVTLTKAPQAEKMGKKRVCKFSKGDYTAASFQALWSPEKLSQACETLLADALKPVSASVGGTQDKALEDLMRQVQELQNQKQQNTQMLQDLVALVQQQGSHPAASQTEPAATTTSNASGAVETLQAGAANTPLRANPYRVTVSPQEMLRQRMAGLSASTVQPSYPQIENRPSNSSVPVSRQPVKANQTPQSGPAETATALAVAFAALIAWKFVKTFGLSRNA